MGGKPRGDFVSGLRVASQFFQCINVEIVKAKWPNSTGRCGKDPCAISLLAKHYNCLVILCSKTWCVVDTSFGFHESYG